MSNSTMHTIRLQDGMLCNFNHQLIISGVSLLTLFRPIPDPTTIARFMSWLRSMVINLCNTFKLRSISDTVHNLEKSTKLLGRFLRMATVI